MDSRKYKTISDCLPCMSSKDVNLRLDVGARLKELLQKGDRKNFTTNDISKLVENLNSWINSSNIKVVICGLNIIELIAQINSEQMRTYLPEIVDNIIERLGDTKDQVRDSSINALISLMTIYGIQVIWEKLLSAFNHKLPRVREGVLETLDLTFIKLGSNELPISKIIKNLGKLLTNDSNQFIRDKSFESIVTIYKHVGNRIVNDVRKLNLPDAKLKLILNKFDEGL